MARKKHKAGRLPANHSTAGARTRRQHGAFAVFPPPACESPVWRHLWTLLAAGLALRLLAAFSADWINRADEIMQYLEQAHRFVFGAGFVPWEIRLGARNMLLIAPAVGVMQLCQAVGGGADCHIIGVELFNALFSLAAPASLYFVGRRLYDERAGRIALAMGCLWYEFVVFAPHLIAEQTAAILILCGLACVPPSAEKGASRLWLAGLLLGLGGLLRLPYIPAAGLLGILILVKMPLRSAPHLLGGALLALAAAGAADFVAWGGFYYSAFAYLEAASLTENFGVVHGVTPWHIQLRKMAVCSAGLWPLIMIAALADRRRHWLPLGIVAVVLLVHAIVNSNFYTHVILATLILALALGGIASHPPEFLRAMFRGGNRLAVAGVFAVVSLLGAAHALPGLSGSFWTELRHPRFFFYEHPSAPVGRFLSRVPPEKMRAALWTAVDPLWTGGYYYFHHSVPYWHEGLPLHRRMLAGKPLSEVASHIAAPDPQGAQRALAAGFEEVANFGGVRVFENPEWEKVASVEKFPLNLGNQDDEIIDRALKDAGKTPPPPQFLSVAE